LRWELLSSLLLFLTLLPFAMAQTSKPRARDLGIPFDGTPGANNALTDVPGVEVGHTTLIAGEGPLKVGVGPVRTGVTAVLPRGQNNADPVMAAWWTLNGNGEMTGTTWVEESGFLEGPVMITNTHSVGVVRDAVVAWQHKNGKTVQPWSLPVVAETYDGFLNDTDGFHVKPEHVFSALDGARPGAVQEGNVGGGTGMVCNGFKGGIGTASRKFTVRDAGNYTLGVLVQCNYGSKDQLRIAGIPVGREITEQTVIGMNRELLEGPDAELGSIIVVVATDAPLLPHQLRRLAHRVSLGLGRLGSISGSGSGDIFIAFSTANPGAAKAEKLMNLQAIPNERIGALFQATVEATEEAVINAMVAAETMTGIDGHRVLALPHDRVREILKKYNRLAN
jgi:L-aminopeptidase/D-esterase-like protein